MGRVANPQPGESPRRFNSYTLRLAEARSRTSVIVSRTARASRKTYDGGVLAPLPNGKMAEQDKALVLKISEAEMPWGFKSLSSRQEPHRGRCVNKT